MEERFPLGLFTESEHPPPGLGDDQATPTTTLEAVLSTLTNHIATTTIDQMEEEVLLDVEQRTGVQLKAKRQ
jgi:hypothetical protein